MKRHLRICKIQKSGGHTLERIAADKVADTLQRLAKRGIEAYVSWFDDKGRRCGGCVGSTGRVPGQRGMKWGWWCDGDLTKNQGEQNEKDSSDSGATSAKK